MYKWGIPHFGLSLFVYWMYHSWGTQRRHQREAMSKEMQGKQSEGRNKVEYLLPLMLFPVPCGESWTQLNNVSGDSQGEAEKTAKIKRGNHICQVSSVFVEVKDKGQKPLDPFDLLSLLCVEPRVWNTEWSLTLDTRGQRVTQTISQMYPLFIGLGRGSVPSHSWSIFSEYTWL